MVNLRRHPEAGIPFGEQVAAMAAMRDEGLIGAVGRAGVIGGEIFSTNQVMRWLAPVPRLERYGG